MNQLIIGDEWFARRYLTRHADVEATLRRLGAVIVMVETADLRMVDRGSEPADASVRFFSEAQRALDAAERDVPAELHPIFVFVTDLSHVVATGAFERWRKPGGTIGAVSARRGLVLGFLAVGEGGVVFFDPAGSSQGVDPSDALVDETLKALAARELLGRERPE